MFRIIMFLLSFIAATQTAVAQRYVFYLHGKIVEDQGAKAYDSRFGAYQYEDILAAFRKENFTVVSEYRQPNTDVKEYARKVADQVKDLLRKGVKPGNITVVGASKGAMIAMYASTFIQNKDVNYVLLSNCNDYNFEGNPDISFCGNMLSIYEKSDPIGGTCAKYKGRSQLPVPHYKEIELNTGLKHGYIYKPLPEWMNPAIKWAKGNYE
jgi:hypothetical protein